VWVTRSSRLAASIGGTVQHVTKTQTGSLTLAANNHLCLIRVRAYHSLRSSIPSLPSVITSSFPPHRQCEI
jgi:hypothetical protein